MLEVPNAGSKFGSAPLGYATSQRCCYQPPPAFGTAENEKAARNGNDAYPKRPGLTWYADQATDRILR